MADGEVKSDKKVPHRTFGRKKEVKLFHIGRVCCINYGPDAGKICVIIDFVDSTRALIDGPASLTGVIRRTIPFKRLSVTSLKVTILRACRSVHLEAACKKADILEKWKLLPWGRKIIQKKLRAKLTDFDRFNVMLLKKQRAALLRKGIWEINCANTRARINKPNRRERWLIAKKNGEENPPDWRGKKSRARFVRKMKLYKKIKAGGPKIEAGSLRIRRHRGHRSLKRSKKQSIPAMKVRKQFQTDLSIKHKQSARAEWCKANPSKMPRIRKKKNRKAKLRTPLGKPALPKACSIKQLAMHRKLYKERRAKWIRGMKNKRRMKAMKIDRSKEERRRARVAAGTEKERVKQPPPISKAAMKLKRAAEKKVYLASKAGAAKK